MSGDYMIQTNQNVWSGQAVSSGYNCTICCVWHQIGCCPGSIQNPFILYPYPYPVPAPAPAPLVNPSAATLVAYAKARLAEVERQLEGVKALETERDQLRRIVDAGK
jgi:hypothetical protein